MTDLIDLVVPLAFVGFIAKVIKKGEEGKEKVKKKIFDKPLKKWNK